MHFLLTALKVVYVLSTPMPEIVDDETLAEVQRKRNKWENDDYICRGHILNGMSDSLFDIYQNVESARDLWNQLESKYMDEDASSKKFLVGNFMNYKMVDFRPVMEQYNELLRILGQFAQHKMEMDESISKDFKHVLKHKKEDLSLIKLGSHLRIEESLRAQDGGKGKGKDVMGSSSVNMMEKGEGSKNKFKGKKRPFNNINDEFDKAPKGQRSNDQGPLTNQGQILDYGFNSVVNYIPLISEAFYVQDDIVAWWIDSGATNHVCKDRLWFKDYEPVKDGSVLYMGKESTSPIIGRGTVVLEFSSRNIIKLCNVLHVPGIRKNLISSSCLCKFGYKQVYESNKYVLSKHGVFIGFGYYCNGYVHYKRLETMSKDGLIPSFNMNINKCNTCMLTKITRQPFGNVSRISHVLELIHSDLCDFYGSPSLGGKKYVVTFIDDFSRLCYIFLLHTKDEAIDKFKVFKNESSGIIHEVTPPYTPQLNGVAERKNRVLKEMVNSMLSYSGLSDGFWGEAMLTACYLLNRIPNKRNNDTLYELWYKKKPRLNYLRVWGCRTVVRLPDPKIKTLGEMDIDSIFIGYAAHSKAYRFYVIEPNDSVAVHSVIKSRDAIFDESCFSSMPKPKDLVPSSSDAIEGSDNVTTQEATPEIRRSKRGRITKSLGPDFHTYLVEGSRDECENFYPYCFHIDEDPKTFDEAMKSHDSSFWKEAVNDETDSIMGNNTWVLADLPRGCKPLGCKWIFKKKMKVDGSIDKFKARLFIQGFRQKEGIDYFYTYAPVARITTIRLLIALAAINNLVIHQMDVKTTFLNGELKEEVYMKQPKGFIMPGNEHKVCKLIKSLYGLKQAPKQWHHKFDESDKCVYNKFDDNGNGVIICLYVHDMLIFGTNQSQVDLTKGFLSSSFAMKDMGEADVILGIKIKQMLKKFNHGKCSPVNTPMDPSVKLMPNKGEAISQLEYSQVIGCLMYAMTSTRPDIAFAFGKLSRYTSNPSHEHWVAVKRVLRYLKQTMDYCLNYVGFPSVLEGYSDASWITNMEDHSFTSGWVFLLGRGAILWASKKQNCITSSTMESEFIALAAAGKEAEWLRNLVYEIPVWPRPIPSISIHCDSSPTLANAYSEVYNGKSRQLGVRHSTVRELITHGIISVDFVRIHHNLADHLTKGLAKDLVRKSVIRIGLKSV
ncbi:hypothetical protein RND81_05G043600 [Saponaria officinalis]|uniref:Integrase catalytic domain-containing protein n=1 Tax=Saponaria officinalis TaxID=3572 RepID=A0AAW1KUM7_SAPOF